MNSDPPEKKGISQESDDGDQKVLDWSTEETVRLPKLTPKDDALPPVEEQIDTDTSETD